jgi:hypothetical protein
MSELSSSGVKLLSAYPRGLLKIFNDADAAPGLQSFLLPIPKMSVPGAPGLDWPIGRNVRFKFSGSLVVTSTGADLLSLESAGMQLICNSGAFPQANPPNLLNSARLSSLTALAEGAPISFDEWLVDCNDLLTMGQFPSFRLFMVVNLNNTGAVPRETIIQGVFQCSAAQFDNYRFDQWE